MIAKKNRSVLLVYLFISLALITGCGDEGDGTPATRERDLPESGMSAASPLPPGMATTAPEPEATATPTPLPTVTPTPTATALPIALAGDPRALAVAEPASQNGAVCGGVDLLDFPLDPPDAEAVSRGGQDFGRFRRRYDGYHTGEDWWGPSRRNSFGQPVYSIGHGQVTYAHPNGWGVDQGVVIIRHVFGDGRTFLSFYGHLDPPSVTLRGGDCVARGDKVGEIGRPRTSPHLHFEIRTHTPGDPGPGYWSTDPTRSGWFPPSETIWSQRAAVSPGVQWTRPPAKESVLQGGLTDNNVLVMAEDSDLVGLSATDGSEMWRHEVFRVDEQDGEEEAEPIAAVAMDRSKALIYAADRRGRLLSFHLPLEAATEDGSSAALPHLAWEITFHNLRGSPTLIPLPRGGVAYVARGRIIGLSPAGALLWRDSFDGQPQEWISFDEEVLVSASGSGPSLWSLNAGGPAAWEEIGGGALARDGQQALLYDGDGVYRLDLETHLAHLLFPLPGGVASQGDIAVLPDGQILVAHMAGGARRLLALDAGGVLRWERSYEGLLDGRPQLVVVDGEPYLLSEENNRSWSRITLFSLSHEEPALTRLFDGGTRTPDRGVTWTIPVDAGNVLLNIGGGNLVALNAEEALRRVCRAVAEVAAPAC